MTKTLRTRTPQPLSQPALALPRRPQALPQMAVPSRLRPSLNETAVFQADPRTDTAFCDFSFPRNQPRS
jgi:hypothetical protein